MWGKLETATQVSVRAQQRVLLADREVAACEHACILLGQQMESQARTNHDILDELRERGRGAEQRALALEGQMRVAQASATGAASKEAVAMLAQHQREITAEASSFLAARQAVTAEEIAQAQRETRRYEEMARRVTAGTQATSAMEQQWAHAAAAWASELADSGARHDHVAAQLRLVEHKAHASVSQLRMAEQTMHAAGETARHADHEVVVWRNRYYDECSACIAAGAAAQRRVEEVSRSAAETCDSLRRFSAAQGGRQEPVRREPGHGGQRAADDGGGWETWYGVGDVDDGVDDPTSGGERPWDGGGLGERQQGGHQPEHRRQGAPGASGGPGSLPGGSARAGVTADVSSPATPGRALRKEAEKVVVPDYPSIAGVRGWMATLMHNVAAASAHDDPARVVTWMKQVTAPRARLEDFDVCESEFQSLDGKLMTAMKTMLDRSSAKAKPIVHRVEREMQNAIHRNALIRGRHIVFLLIDSFRSFDNSDVYYGYDHLMTLTMAGTDLESFVHSWEHIVDNIQGGTPPGASLREPFYRKIKGCAALEYDIREYERMPEGHANKTYEWLYARVQLVLRNKRMTSNLEERDQAIREAANPRNKRHNDSAAPAASSLGVSSGHSPSRREASQNVSSERAPGKGTGGKIGTGSKGKKGTVRTLSPKGKGKGQPPGKGDVKGKSAAGHCFYFHKGQCARGTECRFLHDRSLSAAEVAKPLHAPTSRASSKGPGGKGPGDGVPATYCYRFV